MDRKLFWLNIIIALFDTVVCAAVVVMFGYAAFHFGKWWITLFALLPLLLFENHTMIIDADIHQAKVDSYKPQKGGENDNTTD